MVNALLADAALEAIVGERVFWRYGPNGGLSLEEQPTAFDADNDVLPSLVVVKEERIRPLDKPKVEMLVGVQRIAVWAFQARGYDQVALALRATHRVLRPEDGPPTWVVTGTDA